MKIVLLGRLNTGDILTGPEKVSLNLFQKISEEYHTVFIEYFQKNSARSNLFTRFLGKYIKDENERILSVVILFLQIYIFFSMFMTDAWLWGQCGMLWGFILGLSVANYNILSKRVPALNV